MIYSAELKDKDESFRGIKFIYDEDKIDTIDVVFKLQGDVFVMNANYSECLKLVDFLTKHLI